MGERGHLSRYAVCRTGEIIWVDDEYPECLVLGELPDGRVHAECVTTGVSLAVSGIHWVER